MGLISRINRLFTHPRDKENDFGIRALLHIPVGLLLGVPILGWGLVIMFIFYEQNEDRHTLDQAWKDMYGAMVGASISQLVISAALIYLMVTTW